VNRSVRALVAAAAATGLACGALEQGARVHRPPAEASLAYGRARDDLVAGDATGAERELRAVLALDPDHVPAWRLLQDLQISTLRRGEALAEAEDALARRPGDALALVRLSRVRQGEARKKLLLDALDLDPRCGWAELGLSAWEESFLRPGAGLEAADRARRLLPEEPAPLLAFARSAAAGGKDELALDAVSEGLARFGSAEPGFVDLRLRLGLASAARGSSLAMPLAIEAVSPHLDAACADAGATWALAASVRTGLPAVERDRIEEALARARDEVQGGRAVAPSLRATRAWLDGALAVATGRAGAARLALEEASVAGGRSTALAEALRLARVRTGDFKGAAEAFRSWIAPLESVVGRLDERVTRAVAALEAADPARADTLIEAARAASAIGWLEEAAELAVQARRAGGGADADEIGDAADRFDRFLRTMATALALGFASNRAPVSLVHALEPLAVLGERTLGFDPVAGSRIETWFPVGALLVSEPGSPGLPAAFGRHGYEVRLGKRTLGPIEAFALRVLADAPVDVHLLGRRAQGREAIGVGRSLLTRIEAGGARIAGATLPGSVFLAADVVLDDAADWERWRGAIAAPQSLPRVDDDRLSASEPWDAPQRLVLRALERDPSPLAPRWFRIVRDHERGHLADAGALLPVLAHLPQLFSWLLASGFSLEGIEERLELRAQLAALAVSDDPELVLAEILESAERPASSWPHSRAYADLADRFVDEVDRREIGGLDRSGPIAPQLWKLDAATIRSVARALAEHEGIVAPELPSSRP